MSQSGRPRAPLPIVPASSRTLLLVLCGTPEELKDAVTAAFSAAAQPRRVHVWCDEVLDAPSAGAQSAGPQSAEGEVKKYLHDRGLYLWASNVCWNSGAASALPHHSRMKVAAQYAADRLLDFTFFALGHGVQFYSGWDGILLSQYDAAAQQPHGAALCFTTCPAGDGTPTYLRFEQRSGASLPGVVVAARAPSSVAMNLSTGAWSSAFSFAPTKLHHIVPFDAQLQVGGTQPDFVYGARLWCAGVRLLHPAACPIMSIDRADVALSVAQLQRLKITLGIWVMTGTDAAIGAPVLTVQQLAAYGEYAGLDLARGLVHNSGAYGLTTDTCNREYFVKTGGMT